MKTKLPSLGERLCAARKLQFPKDGVRGFATRIGVSPGTLIKMEKGDLSVTMTHYYTAAEVLGLEKTFDRLLVSEGSLFDD